MTCEGVRLIYLGFEKPDVNEVLRDTSVCLRQVFRFIHKYAAGAALYFIIITISVPKAIISDMAS